MLRAIVSEQKGFNAAVPSLRVCWNYQHTIFRSRTQIGDQLLIERYEARKPAKAGIAGPVEVQAPPAEIEPAAQRQAAVPMAPQSSSAAVSSMAATKIR